MEKQQWRTTMHTTVILELPIHPPESDLALLTVHCKITTHYRREGPVHPTKFYVEGNERKAKNAGGWLFFAEKRELHGSGLHTSAEPIFDRVPIIHFG
jgi:hypothetical protein